MRKFGKPIVQKGSDKRIQKNFYEIVTDLSRQHTKKFAEKNKISRGDKVLSKKEIAKKLKITPDKLRNYSRFFVDPKNPKSQKPPESVVKKLRALAGKKKQRITRVKGMFFPRFAMSSFGELVSERTFTEIKKQLTKSEVIGMLFRVNVIIYTNSGAYNDWMSFLIVRSVDGYLFKTLKTLNGFLTGEIKKRVESGNSINYFEIVQIIAEPVLREYINFKNSKPAGKSKKPRKGKR